MLLCPLQSFRRNLLITYPFPLGIKGASALSFNNQGRKSIWRVGGGCFFLQTSSCVAGWAQGKAEAHSALKHPPASSHHSWDCSMPPVWAAALSERGAGPARRAYNLCELLFWESAGRLSSQPQFLALRIVCMLDFTLKVCWMTYTLSWFYPQLGIDSKKVNKLWTSQLLADLLPYCIAQEPRLLDFSNSFIPRPLCLAFPSVLEGHAV